MLREEVHLPRQLLDVEGDAVREVGRALELGAATLQRRDQSDGLSIAGGVLGWRHGAEVSLQRDVAEVLEGEDPEIAGMPKHGRNRHRHLLEQPRDVDERQRVEVERRRVERQHDRRGVGEQHAVVAPVGSVAGERHDARRLPREIAPLEIRIDSLALAGGVGYLVAHDQYGSFRKWTDEQVPVDALVRPRVSGQRRRRCAHRS